MNNYGNDNRDFKIEWNEWDKAILEELKGYIERDSVGESLKCINHAVNSYLNKAVLQVQGLQVGEFTTPEKQKQALEKILQNSLKASEIAKELRKFYHL